MCANRWGAGAWYSPPCYGAASSHGDAKQICSVGGFQWVDVAGKLEPIGRTTDPRTQAMQVTAEQRSQASARPAAYTSLPNQPCQPCIPVPPLRCSMQRRLVQSGGFGFGGGILQPRPLLPPSSPSPPTAPPRPPAPPAPPPQPPYIPWFPPAPPSPPDFGACDGTPRRLRLSVQAPGDADLSAIVTAGMQALSDFRAGPRETDVCELDTEKVGTAAAEGCAAGRSFVVSDAV